VAEKKLVGFAVWTTVVGGLVLILAITFLTSPHTTCPEAGMRCGPIFFWPGFVLFLFAPFLFVIAAYLAYAGLQEDPPTAPTRAGSATPSLRAVSSAASFCPSCGKPLTGAWDFCPYCGTRVH